MNELISISAKAEPAVFGPGVAEDDLLALSGNQGAPSLPAGVLNLGACVSIHAFGTLATDFADQNDFCRLQIKVKLGGVIGDTGVMVFPVYRGTAEWELTTLITVRAGGVVCDGFFNCPGRITPKHLAIWAPSREPFGGSRSRIFGFNFGNANTLQIRAEFFTGNGQIVMEQCSIVYLP